MIAYNAAIISIIKLFLISKFIYYIRFLEEYSIINDNSYSFLKLLSLNEIYEGIKFLENKIGVKKMDNKPETSMDDFDEKSKRLVRKWFSLRSLAKSTQETYIIYMKQFLKYHGTTLYDIYVKAYREQEENIPDTIRSLTNYILDYKYYLDNSNYSDSTKYLKLKVIISFCRAYKLEIPDIRQKRGLCEPKNYERPITKDELLLMLNTSPLREQAFLTLQATTGMGSKEVRKLTLWDILESINKECDSRYQTINEILNNRDNILEHRVFEFNIVREKVNYRYITFTTSEGMERILRYIDYRYNYCNDKLSLNDDVDEYIFITNQGRPMEQRTVTAMYRIMGERVGFKTKPNQYRFWRSHNIRKYFYNIVEECVGSEYADEWLGHVPNNVTRAYARREYRMRNAYINCIPYLSLTSNYERGNGRIEHKILMLEKELKRLKEEWD